MKCWICGKDGNTHRNIGQRHFVFNDFIPYSEESQRCYCPDCFSIVTEQYENDLSEYIRLKKKLMFERAVRTLEKQKLDIYDYEEAIKAVGDFAGWEIVRIKTDYIEQKADLLVEAIKTVLEKRRKAL